MDMVGEEEVAGGGYAAPGTADGAAAEEGFGGQAEEDLPDGDLVWDSREEWCRSCCTRGLRHGLSVWIRGRSGNSSSRVVW